MLDLALSVPAPVAGSGLGILAFLNVQEATFMRAILAILLVSVRASVVAHVWLGVRKVHQAVLST